MKTIKYYASNNQYMGWNKFCNKNLSELENWISSGNYATVNDKIWKQ